MGDVGKAGDVDRLAWYREAKFGLFIHWGAYTVAGAEASWPIMAPRLSEAMFATPSRISESEYRGLPARFDPVDFDAEAWVGMAKAAGMRYIVFTAKHHDGFCMFDAPGTDYKITRTPFGRDICLELSQACAKAGLRLGFYYSPPDMHHPGFRDVSKPATSNWLGEPGRAGWAGYLDYMESHLRALLTGYGEVSVIWFDGLCNHAKYDPERFHRLIHELSPATLINDRLGEGYDFVTPEQFIPKVGVPVRTGLPPSGNGKDSEDFFRLVTALFGIPGIRGLIRKQMQRYSDGSLELAPVPQEPFPAPERFQAWETCMTMGRSWAFNPEETAWKEPRELLRNLVSVSSRGGNYLLNVGPTDRGLFPPEAVARLAAIGAWMSKHADSIQGSSYTPLGNFPWGRATMKGDRLFLHVFERPADGRVVVEGFPGTVRAVAVLGGPALGHSLARSPAGERLVIDLPEATCDPDITVLEVGIDGSEPAWTDWSPVPAEEPRRRRYLAGQMRGSAIINGVVNGIIALLTNLPRATLPTADLAWDIPITVGIVTFLTSWVLVGAARSELGKGGFKRDLPGWISTRLPKGAVLRSLVIALACAAGLGSLLDRIVTVAGADILNWVYILFKASYAALAGALAVYLAVKSVLHEGAPGGSGAGVAQSRVAGGSGKA